MLVIFWYQFPLRDFELRHVYSILEELHDLRCLTIGIFVKVFLVAYLGLWRSFLLLECRSPRKLIFSHSGVNYDHV